MTNSADPDQLASRNRLIWIYTVCKDKAYPGSAGPGLLDVKTICMATGVCVGFLIMAASITGRKAMAVKAFLTSAVTLSVVGRQV